MPGHRDAEEEPSERYRIDANPKVLGGHTITCLACGLTSFHPEDVARRYCPRCHVFHRDADLADRLEAEMKRGWHGS